MLYFELLCVFFPVRLSDLELGKRNCEFINMTYSDPLTPNVTRNAVIIRGPSDVTRREAVFIHFRLTDLTRDFFTVSYFLFPDWDLFNRRFASCCLFIN